MSLWSLIDQPQSPTYGGEESAEQKSEAGVETRENDVPNAFQEFEEGMKQHDRGAENQDEHHKKLGHEDQKQEMQKDRHHEENEEEDNKDANETDKERVQEVAGNADAKKQSSSAVSIKEGTLQTREQFPVVTGYALTVYKAQGLTLKESVVITFNE